MLKIALVGKMRAGKDLAGTYLIDRYNFDRVAFGDGIRMLCNAIYPDIMREADEAGKKPRAMLQDVGQFLRQYDENVWVRIAFDKIPYISQSAGNVVITDLRQPNELVRCKEEGFTIIRINALEKIRQDRMLMSGDDVDPLRLGHETESHVDNFEVDYEIDNNTELEHLYRQLDGIVQKLMSKADKTTVNDNLGGLYETKEMILSAQERYEDSNYLLNELNSINKKIEFWEGVKAYESIH